MEGIPEGPTFDRTEAIKHLAETRELLDDMQRQHQELMSQLTTRLYNLEQLISAKEPVGETADDFFDADKPTGEKPGPYKFKLGDLDEDF